MIGLWRALHGNRDTVAIVYTLTLVFLGYSGLGISLWPHIVPPALSIYDAAGPPQSLGFTLVGALLIIPLILMYTAKGLLGVPRQGAARRRVPLMATRSAHPAPRWRTRA